MNSEWGMVNSQWSIQAKAFTHVKVFSFKGDHLQINSGDFDFHPS
jgi:hypothetical protein